MSEEFPGPHMAIEDFEKKVRGPAGRQAGRSGMGERAWRSCQADMLNDRHGFLNKAGGEGKAFGTFKEELLAAMEAKRTMRTKRRI
jgi:hypothetical protein